MQRHRTICGYTYILACMLMLTSCIQMSEKETDPLAGLNGGFEISKNGLPVNWIMYTPNTVPNADFEIHLDNAVFKEGKQSLRFNIKECSQTGGWLSPGFTNEFFDVNKFEGEAKYKISLWIKNDGTKFNISAGGVSAFEGDMRVLVEDKNQLEEWTFLEYEINVIQDHHLRMQLSLLQPGTFWIDDIRIERL